MTEVQQVDDGMCPLWKPFMGYVGRPALSVRTQCNCIASRALTASRAACRWSICLLLLTCKQSNPGAFVQGEPRFERHKHHLQLEGLSKQLHGRTAAERGGARVQGARAGGIRHHNRDPDRL